MGKQIRVIVALVVVIGVAYWAINLVRVRQYSGAKLSFNVGSGYLVVTNPGSEAIPVEMRSEGRAAIFRVESADFDLKEASKRQNNGSNPYHAMSFELPPGQAKIDVTRGSKVQFISSSSQRIEAVVNPVEANGVRNTWVFVAVVTIGALYYISRTLEHLWLAQLRGKLPTRLQGLRRPVS